MRLNKFLFLIPLMVFAWAYAGTKQEKGTSGYSKKLPYYSISALKAKKPASGSFNTEGYVVKIYTCPPCPKGALCKPCMRDNILISEKNALLDSYSMTEKEMILFTDRTKNFKLGRKYRFSIKFLDYVSTTEPLNDIKLLGWEPVPPKKKKTP